MNTLKNTISIFNIFISKHPLMKKLAIVLLIKLFIMFIILKFIFFPNFLNTHFKTDTEKSNYIIQSLTTLHK